MSNSQNTTITPDQGFQPVIEPISTWDSVKPYTDHTDRSSAKLPEDLREFVQRDKWPIPATADREFYYDDRHADYWYSGLADFSRFRGYCEKHSAPLSEDSAVFELGCASGRVLRHFAAQADINHCVGSDINSNHCEWVNTFLPESVGAIQNTVHPPLPFESNSFDLTYAVSVFTHMEYSETAWLSELNRITHKDGLIVVTIHSDRTWRDIKGTILYDAIISYGSYGSDEAKVTPELFENPMPGERAVIRMQSHLDVYNTNVFHSVEYIRSVWSRFVDVVEIIPKGHHYHDVVVLRPRKR